MSDQKGNILKRCIIIPKDTQQMNDLKSINIDGGIQIVPDQDIEISLILLYVAKIISTL